MSSNQITHSGKELVSIFFSDLKRYNESNFKTIARADLSKQDATVHKAFSSVVTRYFIFKEKHPEVSEVEHRMLYFKLKLDMIAAYFSEYPDTTTDNLVAFQVELRRYIKENQHPKKKPEDAEEGQVDGQETSLPNIQLGPDNGLPVEQQS